MTDPMTDANATPDPSSPVLTIDGPSGSGQGTISRLVATRLGCPYLDSGALYRAVGVAPGWADPDLADAGALVRCAFASEVALRLAADEHGGEACRGRVCEHVWRSAG